jgi:hypothetical protein
MIKLIFAGDPSKAPSHGQIDAVFNSLSSRRTLQKAPTKRTRRRPADPFAKMTKAEFIAHSEKCLRGPGLLPVRRARR